LLFLGLSRDHWLADPSRYLFLRFRQVGGSYLERDIEVVKGRSMAGEPALLTIRGLNHHIEDAMELWK